MYPLVTVPKRVGQETGCISDLGWRGICYAGTSGHIRKETYSNLFPPQRTDGCGTIGGGCPWIKTEFAFLEPKFCSKLVDSLLGQVRVAKSPNSMFAGREIWENSCAWAPWDWKSQWPSLGWLRRGLDWSLPQDGNGSRRLGCSKLVN